MKAPLINDDGDLVMEDGEIVMINGDEELAQSVESILKTRQGELFDDEEFGLSRDNLLGKPAYQEAAHDDIVETIILQEPRIATVDEIRFDDDHQRRSRTISIKMSKAGEEGTVLLENVDVGS